MARDDPHFRLRLPADLKARVEESAKKSGRSVTAEIVQALTQLFPPEPDMDDLLDSLESALRWAEYPDGPRYSDTIMEQIERIQARLNAGIEFDRQAPRVYSDAEVRWHERSRRDRRWRRAKEHGVLQADLEEQLQKGFLASLGRSNTHAAISSFKEGKPERAMRSIGLSSIKWAEPDKAYAAIEKWLRQFYLENWEDDPDQPYLGEDLD